MAQPDDDASGCGALIGVVLVIGLVVAALISLAAIVDPFSWLPPVGEVWADCEDPDGECDLEDRFPGFWLHAIVNLVYIAVVGAILVVLVASALDLRERRQARFAAAKAAEAYAATRRGFVALAAAGLAAGAGPILVAAL